MRILLSGGAGFIGSNFIHFIQQIRPNWYIVNLDKLTYAGNLHNLDGLPHSNQYEFIHGDICDENLVDSLSKTGFDAVINFAAQSHVDRSLYGPIEFVHTNIQGTLTLLEAAKKHKMKRFLQISSDEVYGSTLGGKFTEETPLHPNNPYSASKAAADHMVMAYGNSHGLDVVITRSSNNYGPRQYPEKFIPLFVTNALANKQCPLYGDGMNVRDWLHVDDNCRGILAALEKGQKGGIYNLGGNNERTNIEVANIILKIIGKPESLIVLVKDRPGHDKRYAIDFSKAETELGWIPRIKFENGLAETIDWYKNQWMGLKA